MRSAVTISLVPEARNGPFVFSAGLEEGCVHAARLGFDAVEIFPTSGDSIEVDQLGATLKRHGLRLAAMGTGAGWVRRKLTLTHADAAVRREACAFVCSIVDAAGELGAPAIIGSMQGRWEGAMNHEEACRLLGDALDDLGRYAARHGVPLLYEPLNRYETNLFNQIGKAASWLRELRIENIRILADLFHMNIEEADSAAAIHEVNSLIGHVHFADSNRRAVGFGQSRVERIVGALREINYQGYLSAEIFPLPDPMAAAERTMAAFRQHVR